MKRLALTFAVLLCVAVLSAQEKSSFSGEYVIKENCTETRHESLCDEISYNIDIQLNGSNLVLNKIHNQFDVNASIFDVDSFRIASQTFMAFDSSNIGVNGYGRVYGDSISIYYNAGGNFGSMYCICKGVRKIQAQTEQPLTVDCGEDIIICPDKCYAFFCIGATDTLFIGQNVKITGGVAPYTYAWSCNQQEQGLKMITASGFLSDTTIANPYFKWSVSTYICPFYLKVTDAKGNIAIDSLTLLREEFLYATTGNADLEKESVGNQIYLTGEQRDLYSVFPMKYFAVIESDTIALPAYITIQETDSVTIFGIDSLGCKDYPRTFYGKWLFVSIDEKTADNNAVKLIDNDLVFNTNSEKQIRIYSAVGQLVYSGSTTDSRFKLPALKNIGNCICSVTIDGKTTSLHLFYK